MVVPTGDASYYRDRPRIAIPRGAVLDLDGQFGLHPRLGGLMPWWRDGSLAVVHAVGSPATTRSHFDAQDYMESGTPGRKSTPDGWGNRYCRHNVEHAETPFRAVAFGPQLPRTLAGTAPTLAIDDLRTFGVQARAGARDRLTRAFEALYEGSATGLLASSSHEGFEAARMLRQADPARQAPSNGAEYPPGRLGQSLRQIAQLIRAGLGLELAFAVVGGWDTHVNQGADQGQLSQRLDELGRALTAFATDLGERMADVVVLTMSEFGRTVRENGNGEAGQKFCAVFRDITQWKRAEEELVHARRQAERANSAKSEFLAKISHEIRTPLNAIIGFAEVMMEERLGPIGNERYREYLKDIHTSGEHLVSLINDLLDLSKIEAGKLDLNFSSVDLNEIASQSMALMQPQANRERIIIRTALSNVLPPVVADARSIRQIVLNLLSNSIRFTPPGGQVIVSTTLTDDGQVHLRVRDTGIGMTESEITTALEPFRQIATSGRGKDSGTGLGLPLTKALVEANRASFTIKSTVNAGTLVEIAFPSTRVLAE
jgi:signal transduction histidine kinase